MIFYPKSSGLTDVRLTMHLTIQQSCSGRWGRDLYFGMDIILIKGFSKHTLSTYFPSMKIDPNCAVLHVFSLIFPSCLFQNL